MFKWFNYSLQFYPLIGEPVHPPFALSVFSDIFIYYICYSEWTERAPPENVLRVVTVMRMLMRDTTFRQKFVVKLTGLKKLCLALERTTDKYLREGETPFIHQILIEMTSRLIMMLGASAVFKYMLVYNSFIII